MGQFEWESSNLHVSYPFEQPGVPGLNDAFADAVIIDTQQAGRVRLASLSVSAWTAGGVSMSVQYAGGGAFFTGSPVTQVSLYGTWAVITVSSDNKSVQLIMSTEHALPITVSAPVSFVTRVQEDDPKSVTSVEVTDSLTSVVHVLTGDIELVSGYNIGSQETELLNPVRAGNVGVTLDAVPGAGFGVAPSDCAPATVVRSINTVGPDTHGRFIIHCKNCFSGVIPPLGGSPLTSTFDPMPACLKIFNDCEQCCKCTDYENAYKALQRIHDKGRNSGLRMARTIDDFKKMLDEISKQKSKREVPTMDLFLRPSHGYIMGIQVNLLNNGVFTDLYMNKDSLETAMVKVTVTSADAQMSGAVVLKKSNYLYNDRYGNPWLHMDDETKLMVNPTEITTGPVGLVVPEGLVTGKAYEVIKTTHHITLFFEIFWKPDVEPADGDVVTVKLESSIFKPYTLTKTEKLIKPFDTADPQ